MLRRSKDIAFCFWLITVELCFLAAALENCSTSNLQPNGYSCTAANIPCYCSSLNQDIIIQCDTTQKLLHYFDGRTGQRLCPLESTGFSEHHKKCLNDSLKQEFKLSKDHYRSHYKACGSVMSKSCVWKDDRTPSSCMCETKTLTLGNAGVSNHLNIYNSFTGELLCNISKTTIQATTTVSTTITTNSKVSPSSHQLIEIESTQITTKSVSTDRPQETTLISETVSSTTVAAEPKLKKEAFLIYSVVCATIFLLLSGMIVLIVKNCKRKTIQIESKTLPKEKEHAIDLNTLYEDNDLYGVVVSEENDLYGEISASRGVELEENNDMYGRVCSQQYGLEENNEMYGRVCSQQYGHEENNDMYGVVK